MTIEADFIDRFKKGSKCLNNYSNKDVQLIKNQYFHLISKTEKDYKNNIFSNFKKYPTSTNIELKDIDDALQFNMLHEGIHLGVILSLKKLL